VSLYLPFANNGPAVQWTWNLIDNSDMSQIAQIDAHDKKLVLQLNNQGTATCWMHLLDPVAEAVVELQTGLSLVRDDEEVWSGGIWQANESSQAGGVGTQKGSDQLAITAFGWFNILGGSGQNCRQVHTGAEFLAMLYVNGTDPSGGLTPGYQAWMAQNNGQAYSWQGGVVVDEATSLTYSASEYPQTSDALIIYDLLARANIDRDTWISQGQVFGSPEQRNLTLQRFQNVGQEVTQLVNVEAGVDWTIDPVTRAMNLYGPGASSSPLIPNGFGQDRGRGCLFSYPGNCVSAARTNDGTIAQNRIEAVGSYGVGRADDLISQNENNLLEYQDSLSEVTDPNILTAYAQAEVAARSQPWQIVTFGPRGVGPGDESVSGVPRPFQDYVVGDVVYCAVDRGRMRIGLDDAPQATRVFGFTVSVSDDGVETVTGLTTNYSSVGGGGS
jgi:hypothetical protein